MNSISIARKLIVLYNLFWYILSTSGAVVFFVILAILEGFVHQVLRILRTLESKYVILIVGLILTIFYSIIELIFNIAHSLYIKYMTNLPEDEKKESLYEIFNEEDY